MEFFLSDLNYMDYRKKVLNGEMNDKLVWVHCVKANPVCLLHKTRIIRPTLCTVKKVKDEKYELVGQTTKGKSKGVKIPCTPDIHITENEFECKNQFKTDINAVLSKLEDLKNSVVGKIVADMRLLELQLEPSQDNPIVVGPSKETVKKLLVTPERTKRVKKAGAV